MVMGSFPLRRQPSCGLTAACLAGDHYGVDDHATKVSLATSLSLLQLVMTPGTFNLPRFFFVFLSLGGSGDTGL